MSAFDPKRTSANYPKARLSSPIRPTLVATGTPRKADHVEKRDPRNADNKARLEKRASKTISLRWDGSGLGRQNRHKDWIAGFQAITLCLARNAPGRGYLKLHPTICDKLFLTKGREL